jgi:hypothetical protein
MKEGDLSIESGVNVEGQPFVAMEFDPLPDDPRMSMPTARARKLGLWLIEAAEAADHDAMFWAWMQDQGFDREKAAALLAQFRMYRRGDADSSSERRERR